MKANLNSINKTTIEVGIAGWVLMVLVIWELIFNRLSSSLGIYAGVGSMGPLAWMANSGEIALNGVGILSFFLVLIVLTRQINSALFVGLWWRGLLGLVSPFYLLVVGLAIVQPVSSWLVIEGYLTAIWTAFFVSILAMSRGTSSSKRRLVFALGLAFLLKAFAWIVLDFSQRSASRESIGLLASRADLLSEVLFLVSPVVAFFAFFIQSAQSFGRFFRRPHWLGFALSLLALGFSLAVLEHISAMPGTFQKTVYLLFGVKYSFEFSSFFHLVSLFFGSLFVGCMVLPSKNWPGGPNNRRIGMGFAFIWLPGILPHHVYQFILVLLGFLLLSLAMAEQKICLLLSKKADAKS